MIQVDAVREYKLTELFTRVRFEQRTETRFAIDEPAVLQVLEARTVLGVRGAGRIAVAVVDVSRSGLGLRSADPLTQGTLIQIRIGGKLVVTGEVRHSTKIGDEFHSGVLVQHVTDVRSHY